MNKKEIAIKCMVLMAAVNFSLKVSARVFTQYSQRLTAGWSYLQGDLGSIWEAVRPARKGSSESVPRWTEVTLPHCFNASDAVDPDQNYYQGPGWYKTLLNVNNPYVNGRILLDFGGAGQKTEVYIYTERVASHVGGYDEWTVDITDAVEKFRKTTECQYRFNGKIPLSIRCDNSRDTEMLPSDLADFNIYGGLYRYVTLAYVPAVSIERLKINTRLDHKQRNATLTIKAFFHNPSAVEKASMNVVVRNPKGKIVLIADKETNPQGEVTLCEKDIINNVELWTDESPNLYTCEITLTDIDGQEQKAVEKFGLRSFEFVEHGPFKLNGKRILLRGTHRHEDHAGVGAAMTDDLIRKEMIMMKEMGVNFIRLGHYQQSQIVLSLCDSLGIMVWEEIPWCRGGLGGEAYQAQAKRMLASMIQVHYNHPSVIIWGLGNENDWKNDFPDFDKGKIRAFMKTLHNLAHSLDSERKTAIRRCKFCSDLVDVYSPSIWAGWYRGVFTEYKSSSYEEMQKVSHFFHAEWGGDCHARRHSEEPFKHLIKIQTGKGTDERAGDASLYGGEVRTAKDGDWSESYMVRLVDWYLKEQETMDWLTGSAYWTFKDFSTPVRPENSVPYVNQKGVVERDLTPKETYYVFQSYWTKRPMLHIYGHTWPIRWGKVGEEREVLVYSNCKQVELFVNGESQGVKTRDSQDYPAAGLHWECKFRQGENIVTAKTLKGEILTDTIRFNYETRKWGKPAKIETKVVHKNDHQLIVEVQLCDTYGIPCLDSKDIIRFDIAGDGKLIDNLGTSTGARQLQAYNGRAAICVNLCGGKSVVAVHCKAEGVNTQFINIE